MEVQGENAAETQLSFVRLMNEGFKLRDVIIPCKIKLQLLIIDQMLLNKFLYEQLQCCRSLLGNISSEFALHHCFLRTILGSLVL